MQSLLRLFTLFTLMAMLTVDLSAQVSVRRRSSGSSAKTEKSAPKEKKNTPAAPVVARETLDTPVVEEQQAPEVPAPAAPAPVATKRTAPKKTGVKQSDLAEGMTLRQQAFAEYQRQEPQYVPWQHVVYRELDMNVGENATLYYPVEPLDGMTNLFRVILAGLCSGDLKAYEYLDGREIFTEKYQVNVEGMLEKFEIPYTVKALGAGRYALHVEETDVPSNEVMSYYLKERWQYDLTGSRYSAKVLAICPVVHRIGEYGGVTRYPMCWIDFEDLRPLLRSHMVMLDGMNNAARFTMEEYFLLNKYKGELYMVQNTRGLNLMQQYPDSASLSEARERIEAELRGFKDSLWVQEPTPEEIEEARPKKKGGKLNRRTKEVVEVEEEPESTEPKAHSARRTRK